MTAQIVGYTASVLDSGNSVRMTLEGSIWSNPADPNHEAALWDAIDVMATYLSSVLDSEYLPVTTKLVRHEKEDITLTHP